MEDEKNPQEENNTLEDGCFELVKKIWVYFIILVVIAYACLMLFNVGISVWGISKYILPDVMKQFSDTPGAISFLLLSAFLMTFGGSLSLDRSHGRWRRYLCGYQRRVG